MKIFLVVSLLHSVTVIQSCLQLLLRRRKYQIFRNTVTHLTNHTSSLLKTSYVYSPQWERSFAYKQISTFGRPLKIHYTCKLDTRSLCYETQFGVCSNMFCKFKPAAHAIHLQDRIHGHTRVTVWNKETAINMVMGSLQWNLVWQRRHKYVHMQLRLPVPNSCKLHYKIRCRVCKLWLWRI
jgi:hypothetical protein